MGARGGPPHRNLLEKGTKTMANPIIPAILAAALGGGQALADDGRPWVDPVRTAELVCERQFHEQGVAITGQMAERVAGLSAEFERTGDVEAYLKGYERAEKEIIDSESLENQRALEECRAEAQAPKPKL